MASYLKKEISEWNTTDLCNWLIDNKYPGISELCQNNSISGYDLFFINDDILKNELGLSSFHERKVTMKLINKLIYEHLKLNIINSNGDNVILTLDNNLDTTLGDLSEYIGGMFNLDPKDILYKDNTKTEVLSPTLKIIKLLILYPRLYKTLNVFNMKDYHQVSENDNLESKNNDYNNNLNLNNNSVADGEAEVEGAATENESDFQKSNRNNNNNNNMNVKMNFDYSLNKPNNNMPNDKEKIVSQKYNINDDNNRIMYNEGGNVNNKKIIYNDDYDIKNKKYKNEQRNYQGIRNETPRNENFEENEENNWDVGDNNDLKYRIRTNYRDNNMNMNMKGYSSLRNKKNLNFNDKPYKENYGNNKSYKNLENRDNNYYNNDMD
jgi:hypothetical protein